ncbi:MAG: DNA/RNA non-specific endonuclease [Bacteroidales bacterium]|nr:DNA/RNA non-specific endonuclease [Bacteroidales bacterium]
MRQRVFIANMMAAMALLLGGCFRASDAAAQAPACTAPKGLELPDYGDTEDLVVHLGYTASYNHVTLCPDWVAWELTAEEVEGENNGDFSFSRDPAVRFPKASREDYAGSGYDKGHMAPRADMKWSCQALEESFYFTNICPQNHEMNSQAWRKIEELTRRMARHYGRVWVVCGPIFDTAATPRTIGGASVWVPQAFFKALAVSTGQGYRTVGFIVENNEQGFAPRHYAVSVDSVEAVVGRDLFPQVPEEAEGAFDWSYWK